jgi:hypothetical protein
VRTAVCLSGQARFISKNFQNILDNLILPTGADVFCHFWNTESEILEPYKAIEVFNPQLYMIERQKTFDDSSWGVVRSDYGFSPKRYQDIHSMHYSISQANVLKQHHERKQGFVYDCVIRSRTDIAFASPFDLSEFNQNPNQIWLCNLEQGPAGDMACADLFAFSNSEQMNFYSNCFTNLPGLLQTHQHLFAETLLHAYLTPKNIALSKMRYSIVRN